MNRTRRWFLQTSGLVAGVGFLGLHCHNPDRPFAESRKTRIPSNYEATPITFAQLPTTTVDTHGTAPGSVITLPDGIRATSLSVRNGLATFISPTADSAGDRLVVVDLFSQKAYEAQLDGKGLGNALQINLGYSHITRLGVAFNGTESPGKHQLRHIDLSNLQRGGLESRITSSLLPDNVIGPSAAYGYNIAGTRVGISFIGSNGSAPELYAMENFGDEWELSSILTDQNLLSFSCVKNNHFYAIGKTNKTARIGLAMDARVQDPEVLSEIPLSRGQTHALRDAQDKTLLLYSQRIQDEERDRKNPIPEQLMLYRVGDEGPIQIMESFAVYAPTASGSAHAGARAVVFHTEEALAPWKMSLISFDGVASQALDLPLSFEVSAAKADGLVYPPVHDSPFGEAMNKLPSTVQLHEDTLVYTNYNSAGRLTLHVNYI